MSRDLSLSIPSHVASYNQNMDDLVLPVSNIESCLKKKCNYYDIISRKYRAIDTVLRLAVDSNDISFLKAGNYMLYNFIQDERTRKHIGCAKKCKASFGAEKTSIAYLQKRLRRVTNHKSVQSTKNLLKKTHEILDS